MTSRLTKQAIHTIIAGAFATTMGTAAAFAEHHEEVSAEKEKCYGVAKAGHNDCANAAGTHACAGMAETDSEGGEWISLPKGICERLAGGSLEPISEDGVEAGSEDIQEDHSH